MKEELFKKIYIKNVNDLPEGKLIHVGIKNGYEEILYIEAGETKKPFRYDDNDTPTININSIAWYLQPIEPVEAEKELRDELIKFWEWVNDGEVSNYATRIQLVDEYLTNK